MQNTYEPSGTGYVENMHRKLRGLELKCSSLDALQNSPQKKMQIDQSCSTRANTVTGKTGVGVSAKDNLALLYRLQANLSFGLNIVSNTTNIA